MSQMKRRSCDSFGAIYLSVLNLHRRSLQPSSFQAFFWGNHHPHFFRWAEKKHTHTHIHPPQWSMWQPLEGETYIQKKNASFEGKIRNISTLRIPGADPPMDGVNFHLFLGQGCLGSGKWRYFFEGSGFLGQTQNVAKRKDCDFTLRFGEKRDPSRERSPIFPI